MKKYVTINNKENTASILLLNILLYSKSDFIVFDFTMKSLPIIVSYFRWRMEYSLTFQLCSLAPLKEKKKENLDPRKKYRLAKCQSMTLLALIFKSSVYVMKIVKKKVENKNCVSFYILLRYFDFYFNFPFPSITFQKQNLVTNNKHIW